MSPKYPRRRRGKDETESSGQRLPGERLQKVLAAAGVASRRECEALILEGRVEVDRQVVTVLGTRVDPQQQEIRVDGTPLPKPRHVYYLVNKPAGVVSTNRDPAGRTRVVDLVPSDKRLFTIGRLDRYSEGLIIVTNDGELTNHLTHPRYGIAKTYRAKVIGFPTAETLDKLRKGIHLAEGMARVASLAVRGRHQRGSELEIVLTEGRNREIRRILAKVGHKVQQLRRTAIGPIRLGKLQAGEYRLLSIDEVRQLRSAVEQLAGPDAGGGKDRARARKVRVAQAPGRAGKVAGKRGKDVPARGAARRAEAKDVSGKKQRKSFAAEQQGGAARTGTVLDYDQPRKGKKRTARPASRPGNQTERNASGARRTQSKAGKKGKRR